MKNIIYPLFVLFTLLFAWSCELEESPKATASANAIFNSKEGLELYANSFYNMLPSAGDVIRGDEMSDYCARNSVPDFIRKDGFSATQSSGWTWTNLRNVNYFIENCNSATLTEQQKQHYIGLAKFFRAWFYFDKVKRFGNVPWYGKTMKEDDPELYKGRDSRTLVMDSVLADLNYACEHITTTTDATRSLVTKYIAYAFKSRVCLFEGTFRKYQTGYQLESTANAWLTEAANAAKKVMDEGGFSIYSAAGTDKSYRQLFTATEPVTSEIMMSNISNLALGVFNDANWYYTSATYGARLSFIRTFVNTYLNIDGSPFTNTIGYQTMVFADEVKNRDKRLQQTIRMGDYKRINGGAQQAAPPIFSYTYTGYQPIKWCLDDVYYDGGSLNVNSICLFRYAEVLLNYAEATAELGMITDADWAKTIGALRQRAGITGGLTAKPVTVDPYLQANYFPEITDPVILEVRRERGIELALEGFRFYDLVRWRRGELMKMTWNGFYVPALDTPMDLNGDGVMDVVFYKVKPATTLNGVTYINVAETISGGSNPQRLSNDSSGELTWLTNIERVWEEKHYLYPIPQSDYLMNKALGQNPGW
ncbi:MAG TPA: RagB/SusD family nutrient uptake outer membrane protein [Bacteroidales bacterium]|nr:RagB/SusD family nutrient uptake outer membrane protein [Bacteroidales bacterium]